MRDSCRAARTGLPGEGATSPLRACVIGAGELRVSDDPEARLTIHALGSCLGVTVHDPVARVGGMLHAALPLSSADPERATRAPGTFVDTGVPALFRECYRLGARKDRMIVTVAGGASAAGEDAEDGFQIGRRNLVVLRKLLWKNGVLVHAEDVGGSQIWRTISLAIGTGRVTLRTSGAERTL